ncbi:MAG: hypothetical protein ACI9T9_001384 [Oleiphilaceae bacterium]|jgi:hypothetical protein
MIARIIIILCSFFFSINFALAKQISSEKKDLVDQLLAINQTDNLIPLMASSLTGKIIAAISHNRGPIDKNLKLAINNEVKNAIYEQFVLNNKFNNIFYGLYDEYFSTDQMQSIVNFYNSPAGKQLRKHSGDITLRSQEQAKVHAKTVGPIVQQRLLKILDKIDEELKLLDAKAATKE